jgi:hypothetical protein
MNYGEVFLTTRFQEVPIYIVNSRPFAVSCLNLTDKDFEGSDIELSDEKLVIF